MPIVPDTAQIPLSLLVDAAAACNESEQDSNLIQYISPELS
jgi:hypothetical protein